jgi:hypothetical protein
MASVDTSPIIDRSPSGGRQIGVRAYDEEGNSSGAQAALID